MKFSLNEFLGPRPYDLKKPKFIPIVSSNSLANIIKLKLGENIYAFSFETTDEETGDPLAGGHNAKPRNKVSYGQDDLINYSKVKDLGYPFYIAGGVASPEKREWVKNQGAKDIALGSIFLLSEDSGLDPEVRKLVRKLAYNGKLVIDTNFDASATGFPFKVAQVPGTLSEKSIYLSRKRECEIGGLVSVYENPKNRNSFIYWCSAGPNLFFPGKDPVHNKICLCDGLCAAARFPRKKGQPIIVTMGDEYKSFITKLMKHENDSYTAEDAVNYLRKKPFKL